MSETEAQETTKAWSTFSFISFLLGSDCYLLASGGSRSHVLSMYRTIILTSVFSVHMCMATVHTFKYGIWNGYLFFCLTMFPAQLEVYVVSSQIQCSASQGDLFFFIRKVKSLKKKIIIIMLYTLYILRFMEIIYCKGFKSFLAII